MQARHKSDHPWKNCALEGCERPLRARGKCVTCYNKHHQKDRHSKTKVMQCFICDKDVTKSASRSARYTVTCSSECRAVLTFGTPLPDDHWARWWGKTSTWPQGAMSVTGKQSHSDWVERSRSPLAVAVRDGAHADVLRYIKKDCVITASGCWEWQRRLSDGYPQIRLNINGKQVNAQVHRLSLEARHGRALGKQAAHHMCANTRCANPEHLQPVTHRENTAEMLERNYYIARIKELEAALDHVAPGHELLTHISLPEAA